MEKNEVVNWEGVKGNPNEHRTTGGRAWCYQDACGTWCYETHVCDCCLTTEGWKPLWLKPDGTIVDENHETFHHMR